MSQIMLNSIRILRHLLAPLVLIALAALIIARNSRADIRISRDAKPLATCALGF